MQSCMMRSDRLMGVYRGRFAKDPSQFKKFGVPARSALLKCLRKGPGRKTVQFLGNPTYTSMVSQDFFPESNRWLLQMSRFHHHLNGRKNMESFQTFLDYFVVVVLWYVTMYHKNMIYILENPRKFIHGSMCPQEEATEKNRGFLKRSSPKITEKLWFRN